MWLDLTEILCKGTYATFSHCVETNEQNHFIYFHLELFLILVAVGCKVTALTLTRMVLYMFGIRWSGNRCQ